MRLPPAVLSSPAAIVARPAPPSVAIVLSPPPSPCSRTTYAYCTGEKECTAKKNGSVGGEAPHHHHNHNPQSRHRNIMSKPTSPGVIILSFRPIKIKLFRSNKSSLLVVHGSCIGGSLNRIRTDDKAQVHVRPSSLSTSSLSITFAKAASAIIDDIECAATSLLMDEESILLLNKGCWVDADPTKLVVINALANIERNRKGDRLVECTELLAVQE